RVTQHRGNFCPGRCVGASAKNVNLIRAVKNRREIIPRRWESGDGGPGARNTRVQIEALGRGKRVAVIVKTADWRKRCRCDPERRQGRTGERSLTPASAECLR